METLLVKDGAYIDGIYICPHHPDKGFEGERPEYKIDCDCRKPKPGLLLQAAREFNIDLSQSYMIGDSDKDVVAGVNAKVKKSFLITKCSLYELIKSNFASL
jgi:D-glycero-D-manno-heptose 1,7-bisphosphate phosphatase